MDTPTLKCKTAAGVTMTIQLRPLNWRETDARAAKIVSDPSKRLKWKKERKGGVNSL